MTHKQNIQEIISIAIQNYDIKNHKEDFTPYTYTTLSGRTETIYVIELTQKPTFIKKIEEAKATIKDTAKWRVDVPSLEDLKDTRIFQTLNGGTFAIKKDGDIVNVCAKMGDEGYSLDNMESVMAYAVNECNGTKLDSFDGNWSFYRKCGFEPRTWIGFNEDIGKSLGWVKGRDLPEPVVFMEYTGNKKRLGKSEIRKERTDFYTKNKEITMDSAIEGEEYEYDVAYRIRDEMMKEDSKQKNIMPKYSTILKVIEKSINKTHDGTSMSGLNGKIKKFAQRYATDDNLHYCAYDENGNMISSIDSYKQYQDKYKDEQFDDLYHNPRNLDLVRNLGHEQLDKHNPSYFDSKYEYEDMYSTLNDYDLAQLRNIGEDSSFRSFTMVSPNGSSITFIKNNNYSEKDNELFGKLASDFENYCIDHVSKCENDTQDIREEIIEKGDKEHGDYTWRIGSDDTKRILDESVKESVNRNGTLYDAIRDYPRLSQFEECNIKVRIRSKESNK